MAMAKWKCPCSDCKQECGRYSNMVRHIKRKHSSGLLDDIKEKTSCATNPTNIFSKNDNVSSARKGPTDDNDLVGSLYAAFKKGLTRQKMIKENERLFPAVIKHYNLSIV